jgi:hypothetical protein
MRKDFTPWKRTKTVDGVSHASDATVEKCRRSS